jgi:hypothetical protein
MKLAVSSRIFVIVVFATTIALSPIGGEAAAGRGLPPGLIQPVKAIDEVPRVEMPAVDVAAYLEEDARRDLAETPAPLRFAAVLDTAISPADAGSWEELADGSSLWRLRIASPGALSLNLALDRFELPEGAALWLYDGNGTMVQGPYTRENRNVQGGLWTAVVLGDEIVVELQLPAGAGHHVDLRIASVNHGYREFGEVGALASPKQGSCNIDVICPEGDPWRDQIRATARITISGAFLCSAQLINNTAEDGTPYMLTAQHCIENASQAPSVVAFWNYESPSCGFLAGGSLAENQSGASLVAKWDYQTGSDFALILLDQVPNPSFNVYYSGWDATGSIPSGSVGIHHPSGDEKAISFNTDPLDKVNYYGTGSNQWRINQWELGTTEGGSSGSCIYDPDSGLCVGTLTAGTAACSNPSGYDIYGRMDAHWTGNGSPTGRLSDWLDPLGTGALTLGGRDSGAGTSNQTWLVPAAASAPGVGTSNWKTQIVVANPTGEARTARIFFVEKGASWPGASLSGPHSIPAGGSLALDDPLAGLNPTSGLLYVAVDGEGMPVTTRTYNLAADGGTFGQGIPGILLNTAVSSHKLILPMLLSDPARFRTNLGLVQTSAGAMAIRVQLHAPDGTVLATKGYGTAAAFTQINNLLNDMGIGNTVVDGGWISVELIGGSPAYWTAYASIVDGSTDDPTYILPVAE